MLTTAALALQTLPEVCLWDPPIPIRVLTWARILNPAGKQCEAILDFDNSIDLPVRFAFGAVECPGIQLSKLIVPKGVPSGNAYLLWHCLGQAPSCVRVNIADGTGLPDMTQGVGTSECIVDARQTTTTVLTRTSAGSEMVETVTAVHTVESTFIPRTIRPSISPQSSSSSGPGSMGPGAQEQTELTRTTASSTMPTVTAPSITSTAANFQESGTVQAPRFESMASWAAPDLYLIGRTLDPYPLDKPLDVHLLREPPDLCSNQHS
ncbi:hypothetical protein PG988_006510 [Apiospora saccharicola]